jgi:hypothetical protein
MTASFLIRAGLLVAFAIGLAAAPAQAQAPQQPPAGAVAAAKDLLILKGGQMMFGAIVPGTIQRARDTFLPTNPNLSKELNEVNTKLQQEYKGKADELITEVAKSYAARFSEKELRDLIAFYQTPLGKKLLVEEPPAIESGFARAKEWANDFSNQVISRYRSEMKKKGYDL